MRARHPTSVQRHPELGQLIGGLTPAHHLLRLAQPGTRRRTTSPETTTPRPPTAPQQRHGHRSTPAAVAVHRRPRLRRRDRVDKTPGAPPARPAHTPPPSACHHHDQRVLHKGVPSPVPGVRRVPRSVSTELDYRPRLTV